MPEWRSTEDDKPPRVRFVDVVEFCIADGPEDSLYAALSCLWGSAAHSRLANTRRTAEWLRNPGCLLQDIVPKTIFDAIQVARSIGFKYLWVDSLKRHPQQAMVPVSSSLCLIRSTHLYTGTAYERSSWKRRAWTMQESLLSRRLIMFTDDEVFWRWQKATWCESLALELCSTQRRESRIISYQSFGCYDLMEIGPSRAFSPEYAYRVISQYAKRSITNQSECSQ